MTSERHRRVYETSDVVIAFARQGVAIDTIARAIVVPTENVEKVCSRAIVAGDLLRMPPKSTDSPRDSLMTEIVHLRDRVDQLSSIVRELRAEESDDTRGFQGLCRLTGKEAQIVTALARHPGQGRSKMNLYTSIYGLHNDEDAPNPKIIDVFICKIRPKLPEGCAIDTVWGWGYSMSRDSVAILERLRDSEIESPSMVPAQEPETVPA